MGSTSVMELSNGTFSTTNIGWEILTNPHSESSFVNSKAGAAAGEKLWKELAAKLERISPGVMENL
jgi:hypothetical protein